MKYTGTKTEQNLRTAFAGESQARNKYTYFASEVTNKLLRCFQKPPKMKKNMLKCGLKN